MVQCSNCGQEIAPEFAFCTTCGTPKPAEAAATWPDPSPATRTAGEAFPPAKHLTAASPPPAPPPTASGPDLEASAPRFTAGSELLGEAAPNSVYLGMRMHYEKERDLEELDPLQSRRFQRELLIHTALCWIIWFVGQSILWVMTVVLVFVNKDLIAFGILLMGIWFFAVGIVYWFRKLPGQLSEWKFTVDGRGAAASMAFDHIAWSLQRRRSELDSLGLRRFDIMSQSSRDLLELRQGTYYGLVSCFANGEDLYIGWTFWLLLSPAGFLLIWLKRLIWSLRFRGHAVYVSLQFDRPKAMREAMHSAVREGVDVAAGEVEAQGRGTIGSIVPIVADASFRTSR